MTRVCETSTFTWHASHGTPSVAVWQPVMFEFFAAIAAKIGGAAWVGYVATATVAMSVTAVGVVVVGGQASEIRLVQVELPFSFSPPNLVTVSETIFAVQKTASGVAALVVAPAGAGGQPGQVVELTQLQPSELKITSVNAKILVEAKSDNQNIQKLSQAKDDSSSFKTSTDAKLVLDPPTPVPTQQPSLLGGLLGLVGNKPAPANTPAPNPPVSTQPAVAGSLPPIANGNTLAIAIQSSATTPPSPVATNPVVSSPVATLPPIVPVPIATPPPSPVASVVPPVPSPLPATAVPAPTVAAATAAPTTPPAPTVAPPTSVPPTSVPPTSVPTSAPQPTDTPVPPTPTNTPPTPRSTHGHTHASANQHHHGPPSDRLHVTERNHPRKFDNRFPKHHQHGLLELHLRLTITCTSGCTSPLWTDTANGMQIKVSRPANSTTPTLTVAPSPACQVEPAVA